MSAGTSSAPTALPNDRVRISRTVAIIKNHALDYRMAIERKIEEASFEIVKERQMEFDENSDFEFLEELFGDDVPSLFEGPVWVYVLERRRAVEVFKALMGEADPVIARQHSPNSIRSLFGESRMDNAIMGSPSLDIAEEQISCLFQSSPPFPPQDDDDDDDMDEPDDFDLASNRDALSPSSSYQSHSVHRVSSDSRATTSVTSNGSQDTSPSRKSAFKARPIPKTMVLPHIEPRMSRTAALRMGVASPSLGTDSPRVRRTKEEQKLLFLNVPGHKRTETINVTSTAPPARPPRLSRAAALRMGLPDSAPQKTKPRSPSSQTDRRDVFTGVPGHKRAEIILVASVQAPAIPPRLNKSAELRVKRDSAPPTSFMFRQATVPKLPGAFSRSPSAQSPTSSSPAPSRPRSSLDGSLRSPMGSRPLSALNGRRSSLGISSSTPIRPPIIEPKMNRSALLRAAKMQAAAVSQPLATVKKSAASRRGSRAVE